MKVLLHSMSEQESGGSSVEANADCPGYYPEKSLADIVDDGVLDRQLPESGFL